MRVLFLTNIPSPYRVDFFNELGKYCDLTVTFEGEKATDRDDKWKASESHNFNAVYLNGFRVSSDKFLSFKIIKILSEKWDAIIIGGYSTPTSIAAIEYLKLKKQKFFIEADGGFIGKDSWLKYKLKRHLISSASWWFSSGYETTKYLVHYGAIEARCYWFPFTSLKEIDMRHAKLIKKEYARKQLGVNEKKVILAVGRFIKLKGYDVLIEAVKNLDGNVGVYIVGGKPPDEYQQLKDKYNLSNLHFIDFQLKDEICFYYAAADIFIHPTRSDVWGLVINEAMAFGLPIITTDRCVAGLELVSDENGKIIPVDDTIGLSVAINSILNSSDIKTKGNKSLEKIKKYTIENMALEHIRILRNLHV